MQAGTRATASRLKQQIRERYGTYVHLAGRGEQIPNEHTYCDIDPEVVDQWGIPVLRFHFDWTENELKQARHMHETFKAILETMGGKIVGPPPATARGRRHLDRRRNHPRAGDRPHGQRSGQIAC